MSRNYLQGVERAIDQAGRPFKIIITKTPTGIYAVDENYDGPEDKDGMGHGDTTAEAIVDLLEKRGLIEVETGAW